VLFEVSNRSSICIGSSDVRCMFFFFGGRVGVLILYDWEYRVLLTYYFVSHWLLMSIVRSL
jgi:hypothetical protein